ncbi:Na+/H+ antiporter NhaA [Streptomyces qaidamensis]|uniref:Na+/H+ antiporter NhaA n=1 Tax=Streptomyces qaidamensis TaxID=1783515 RepID=UPI003661FC79
MHIKSARQPLVNWGTKAGAVGVTTSQGCRWPAVPGRPTVRAAADIAVLGGVGFTVSLLIAELSYTSEVKCTSRW